MAQARDGGRAGAASAAASAAGNSDDGPTSTIRCPMCRRDVQRDETVWVHTETQQAIRASLMSLATDIFYYHDR